jgi:hypothetical protein
LRQNPEGFVQAAKALYCRKLISRNILLKFLTRGRQISKCDAATFLPFGVAGRCLFFIPVAFLLVRVLHRRRQQPAKKSANSNRLRCVKSEVSHGISTKNSGVRIDLANSKWCLKGGGAQKRQEKAEKQSGGALKGVDQCDTHKKNAHFRG